MDHKSAALVLIDNGPMTPLLGPMGVGHLWRKGWGGVGIQEAEVIDGHWLQEAAMAHQRAALAAIGVGEVVGLKWRDQLFLMPHPRSLLFSHQARCILLYTFKRNRTLAVNADKPHLWKPD